jgi:hypothetical protein
MEWSVARRQVKMLTQDRKRDPGKEVVESVSQECRPELGRYLLQVDKQTKGFFPTPEAAHSAGLKIKKSFPILQVAIYDDIQNTRTLVKLPAGSA